MKGAHWIGLLAGLCLSLSSAAWGRDRLLLDHNWRFTLDDPPDAASQFDFQEVHDLTKAQVNASEEEAGLAATRVDPVAANLGHTVTYVQSDFNDSSWRQLDLPHDWAVELPFDAKADNGHGSKKIGPTLGNTIGWYRRRFDLPAEDAGRSLWIEFDGVYRNSVVWINGHCLGRNVSGYSTFWFDISKYANAGGSNELVVRVDASRIEGWFYEGAGIYRHVWLVAADPVHVSHWGTFITSDISAASATVTARATIANDTTQPVDCDVTQTILDSDGSSVGQTVVRGVHINSGAQCEISPTVSIDNPHLWSLEDPHLYTLSTTVSRSGTNTDQYTTPFGLRTLRFDANQGFFLNGKRVEIQGTCNHQDMAGVGSALPDRLQYFRVEKLKEMGSNAYRTTHNDPTSELLDACDRLGMLVMDEHREMGETPEILDQLTRQVMRDRNHPSVFLWSIGNEEGAIQANDAGARIAKTMQDLVHGLDPTRLCTEAMNNGWGHGLSDVIDVQGFNFLKQGGGGGGGRGRGNATPSTSPSYTAMDRFHAAFPDKPSIGTEEASTLSTRGVYVNDRTHSWMSAYDVNSPNWGTTAGMWWPYYLSRPWVAGAFVWTGFDYRGEPTPYRWPAVSSQFGIMDTCGFPKDNFYYYQAWWTNKPVLRLLPHWNWPGKEGQPIDVWCFSNYDAVELLLNGQSLGKLPMPRNGHLQWSVRYAPGELEARGYSGDALAATTRIQTTGSPAKIILTPDRGSIDADGQDVSVITVAIADDQNRTVPTATNLVKFTVSGDATIIGVGNGDPASHEADKASQRSAFSGLCMAIVQSGVKAGPIQITAQSDGLAPATTTLNAKSVAPIPALP
jgi:beta-galactosidase